MNVFPADVAEDLMKCAMAIGRNYAGERYQKTDSELGHPKELLKKHTENFTTKMEGLLSADTFEDIKMMFLIQAWSIKVLGRNGASKLNGNDLEEEMYGRIQRRGELSDALASAIRSMGSNIAWYTANQTVKAEYGGKDYTKNYEKKYKEDYGKICGEVNIVAIKFDTDKAKILASQPKVLAQQSLKNNSDIQQQMTFSFSVTKGTTKTTSNQIAFNCGVKAGIQAGFSLAVEGKATFEANLEISGSHTSGTSIQNGTTKTYTFPLNVPGKSIYEAKGIVFEAEMEVPYELKLDFGGATKSIRGIWTGVAVSTATYEVNPIKVS